jgi:hypothetical protein
VPRGGEIIVCRGAASSVCAAGRRVLCVPRGGEFYVCRGAARSVRAAGRRGLCVPRGGEFCVCRGAARSVSLPRGGGGFGASVPLSSCPEPQPLGVGERCSLSRSLPSCPTRGLSGGLCGEVSISAWLRSRFQHFAFLPFAGERCFRYHRWQVLCERCCFIIQCFMQFHSFIEKLFLDLRDGDLAQSLHCRLVF